MTTTPHTRADLAAGEHPPRPRWLAFGILATAALGCGGGGGDPTTTPGEPTATSAPVTSPPEVTATPDPTSPVGGTPTPAGTPTPGQTPTPEGTPTATLPPETESPPPVTEEPATPAPTAAPTEEEGTATPDAPTVTPTPPAERLGDAVALTEGNTLVSFDVGRPGVVLEEAALSGLQDGEVILAIDFRPATGALYGLGSSNRIYLLDETTGQATAVGGGAFSPALDGTSFGMDFNPTVDRIRVVSDTGQNLRLHPDTGAVAATDAELAYALLDVGVGDTPGIGGAAYTNSFLGATSTTLYNIDVDNDVLVTQAPPNDGTLNTVGALGIDADGVAGFDIGGRGQAIAALAPAGQSAANLYAVNLSTGAATSLGALGSAGAVRGLALRPSPPPLVYGVTLAGALVSFRAGAPGVLLSSHPITGLAEGESLHAIDFRPATGQLYALGSSSRLYTLDRSTGVATRVGSDPLTPALAGASFGMDFNPTVDRIRVTSDSGQNLRLHPDTGVVAATDGALAYGSGDANQGAAPQISGSAYINSWVGSTATSLYNIDVGLNALTLQNPPNNGTLTTVGSLGVDPAGPVAFDIGDHNEGLAAFTLSGEATSRLYAINLSTGAATQLGQIGGDAALRALAILPPPAPVGWAVTSSGELISVSIGKPGVTLSEVSLSGLGEGEQVLALDVRPATGELYALGSFNRLYVVDPESGEASAVGSGPFSPGLNGDNFGMDFNPTVDRIRVVSDTAQNLRLHPVTGVVAATDTALSYALLDTHSGEEPGVCAAAYTNSFVGATSTTLYNLDAALDVLVTQAPPNDGTLNTVGALGVDITTLAGFDIGPHNEGLVVAVPAGQSAPVLYAVNTTSGALTSLGAIGVDGEVVAFTLAR